MARGGKREGAGRKKVEKDLEGIAREFVFPALCQAFKAEPGYWKDRYLTVELSKHQIRKAYGVDGLSIWSKYFKLAKIGGMDRNGVGYKSRWTLHLGAYEIAKLLVESLGHTIKDLPSPGFPPLAMQQKLDAIEAKAQIRKDKKLKDKNTLIETAEIDIEAKY